MPTSATKDGSSQKPRLSQSERLRLAEVVEELTRIEYIKSAASLKVFAIRAWEIVEPATPIMWNWHLDELCEYLEAITFGFLRGEAIEHGPYAGTIPRHLLVNVPPRSMKSYLITIFWPCWEWIQSPPMRYLCVSYAASLSTEHSVKRRRIIESEWYQYGMHNYWGHPEFALTSDQNAKMSYENSATGQMIASSVEGTAIGQGGDRIIIDDPQDPKTAASEAKRVSVNIEWDQGLSTRLNDKRRGAFIIVMQRLHQADLTGHVIEQGEEWIHIRREAVAESDHTIVFPRSGRVVERKTGDLLWPEREGVDELEAIKAKLGSYGFAGQYQQRPTASEGGMVKRDWLRYWVSERRSDDGPEVVVLPAELLTGHRQAWDMGLWGKAKNDYTVGGVGARLGANVYLLDCDRRRLDLPGCIQAVRDMTAKHPKALRKILENAANAPEVMRTLRDEIPGLVAVSAKGDKEARLAGVSPMIESGNVFFPHPREAGWVSECVEELVTFPFAAHDDFTDMLSHMLADFLKESPTDAPRAGGQRVTPTPGSMDTPRVGGGRRKR